MHEFNLESLAPSIERKCPVFKMQMNLCIYLFSNNVSVEGAARIRIRVGSNCKQFFLIKSNSK